MSGHDLDHVRWYGQPSIFRTHVACVFGSTGVEFLISKSYYFQKSLDDFRRKAKSILLKNTQKYNISLIIP